MKKHYSEPSALIIDMQWGTILATSREIIVNPDKTIKGKDVRSTSKAFNTIDWDDIDDDCNA